MEGRDRLGHRQSAGGAGKGGALRGPVPFDVPGAALGGARRDPGQPREDLPAPPVPGGVRARPEEGPGARGGAAAAAARENDARCVLEVRKFQL